MLVVKNGILDRRHGPLTMLGSLVLLLRERSKRGFRGLSRTDWGIASVERFTTGELKGERHKHKGMTVVSEWRW